LLIDFSGHTTHDGDSNAGRTARIDPSPIRGDARTESIDRKGHRLASTLKNPVTHLFHRALLNAQRVANAADRVSDGV